MDVSGVYVAVHVDDSGFGDGPGTSEEGLWEGNGGRGVGGLRGDLLFALAIDVFELDLFFWHI